MESKLEEDTFSPRDHYIECPRNSGSRCAACCVLYDRYKACRRRCASLRKHLAAYPDLPDKAREHFEERKKEDKNKTYSLLGDHCKFAGTHLPNEKFGCTKCEFVAKSERGLKVHMKRSHGRDLE